MQVDGVLQPREGLGVDVRITRSAEIFWAWKRQCKVMHREVSEMSLKKTLACRGTAGAKTRTEESHSNQQLQGR